jgi:hypothetical protein
MSSTNINPVLNYQQPQAALVPQEGPVAIPLILDFTTAAFAEYDLDMLLPLEQSRISMVQTIYVDLSGSPTDGLTIIVNGTNQQINAAPNTQGYYAVMAPNPPKFRFIGTPSTVRIPILLINVPIPGVVWSTT